MLLNIIVFTVETGPQIPSVALALDQLDMFRIEGGRGVMSPSPPHIRVASRNMDGEGSALGRYQEDDILKTISIFLVAQLMLVSPHSTPLVTHHLPPKADFM